MRAREKKREEKRALRNDDVQLVIGCHNSFIYFEEETSSLSLNIRPHHNHRHNHRHNHHLNPPPH
jgi:hypothetical protein